MLGDAELIVEAAQNAKHRCGCTGYDQDHRCFDRSGRNSTGGDKDGSSHLMDGVLERYEEALEILAPIGGPDAQRVQADIHRIIENLKQLMRATVLLGK